MKILNIITRNYKELNRKTFKGLNLFNFNNLRVVMIFPGDREVAGCFKFYGGFC